MTRRASASLRYTTACLALLACLLIPVGTFALLHDQASVEKPLVFGDVETPLTATLKAPSERAPTVESRPGVAPPLSNRATPPPKNSAAWTIRLEPVLPWVVFSWLVGVAVLSARLLGGWVFVQHWRSRLIRPAAREWHAALERIAAALHVRRRVWLFESAAVDTAMVIGWLRPVVLLPAGLITGLTPEQLETLIAHELAHSTPRLPGESPPVRGGNAPVLPSVGLVDFKRIREERENCCDDLVLASGGDEISYAEALARLAEARETELNSRSRRRAAA